MIEVGQVGLLRRKLTDRELLSIAFSGDETMTLNIHPLYLPPEVCWINNTYLWLRTIKNVSAKVCDTFSHCIVIFTLMVHTIRLTADQNIQPVEACWSIAVCLVFIIGISVSVTTANVSTTVIPFSPLRSVPRIHRALLLTTLCASYILTVFHAEQEPETSALMCWTTFAFAWINIFGLLRMISS